MKNLLSLPMIGLLVGMGANIPNVLAGSYTDKPSKGQSSRQLKLVDESDQILKFSQSANAICRDLQTEHGSTSNGYPVPPQPKYTLAAYKQISQLNAPTGQRKNVALWVQLVNESLSEDSNKAANMSATERKNAAFNRHSSQFAADAIALMLGANECSTVSQQIEAVATTSIQSGTVKQSMLKTGANPFAFISRATLDTAAFNKEFRKKTSDNQPYIPETGRVKTVLEANKLLLTNGQVLTLDGIAGDELGKCYSEYAKAKIKDGLAGQTVVIERVPGSNGFYLQSKEGNFNAKLLLNGEAFPGQTSSTDLLSKISTAAAQVGRSYKRGVWSKCPEQAASLKNL